LPVALLLLCLLNLAGCASTPSGNKWKNEHELMLRSMQDLTSQHERDTRRIDRLEQRIVELEQQTQQQNAQIEAISQALEGVQIRLPSRQTAKSATKPTSRLAEKIGKVEAAIQQATAPADKSEEEKNIYTAAYLALKSGRYDEASGQFAQLLNKYPQGEYSDQAWYWLGESLYAQRNNTKAVEALKHVVNDYPDSVKHAAALLRIGLIYQESKRLGDAKAVLTRLLREHGDSPSADRGREALREVEAALTTRKREK